jgi:PTS system mannose-specific IIC component
VERKGFCRPCSPADRAAGDRRVLGDPQGGLLVAPPLELLWLGAVNLGAALPVHEVLATAAITGGAIFAGRALGVGVSPEVAILAVLLCAPLALLGRRADRLIEQWNERLAVHAEAALAGGHLRAAIRWNLYGIAAPFAFAAVAAPLGAAVAATVIPTLLRALPAAEGPLRLGFFAFAALACASGAKALRAREAPRFFFGALAGALAAGVIVGRALS